MAEKDEKGKEELADATEHDGTAETQEGGTPPQPVEPPDPGQSHDPNEPPPPKP